MRKVTEVKFLEQNKTDCETEYKVCLAGTFVGQLFVPNETNKKAVLKTYHVLEKKYLTRIASDVTNKYKLDVSVQTPRKEYEFYTTSFNAPKPKKIPDNLKWRTYIIHGKMYVGKVAEFNYENKIAVAFRIKKYELFADDIVYSVCSLLKKYPLVKLSSAKNPDVFTNIDTTFDTHTIEYIIKNNFNLPSKVIPVETITATPTETPQIIKDVKIDNNVETTSNNNIPEKPVKKYDDSQTIDPVIFFKTLTLTMNKTQTLDKARQSAQQMANLQYVCVKLLDNNGKFVCNMYPQNIEKIREERLAQIKQMMGKIY